MSDATNAPSATITDSAASSAHSGPSLTPDQVAAFREAWIAAGHDPVRFDMATASTPATPTRDASGRYAAPPATGDAPSPVQVLGGTKAPSFNAAQLAEIAESLVRSGVDPQRVREAMAEQDMVPDERSDEERAHDADWGFDQHYEPKDYDLGGIYRDHSLDPARTPALNVAATEWLAKMQAEPGMGKALMDRVLQVGRETAKLDEAGRGLWKAQQRHALESRFSPEKVAETMRLAGYAIKMGGAGDDFHEALRLGMALHDATVVRTLATIGRRIEGWSKGGGKT